MKNAHLVLSSCAATAAATTGTAAAALSGDSLTIRNYGRRPRIVAAWQTNQAAGFGQVAFPTGHDTTRGFRVGVPAADTVLLLSMGSTMEVTPQEVVSVTLAEVATSGDVAQLSFLTMYDEEHGQRLSDWRDVQSRTECLTTVESVIVSVAGVYGPAGGTLINVGSDLFKANREYAVLGASSRTRVHAVSIMGPDTGNDRIGCPLMLRPEVTSQWFRLLSLNLGLPTIPIINSGNKSSTVLQVVTDENAGTFLVTLHLALLK